MAPDHGARAGVRLLLSEWPLVVATLPTLILLLGLMVVVANTLIK
ncbi:hypothetical protein [Streptomyces sp. Go-475]|nr:hypothetical protein [Streptomyces sp. Go-475]